VGTRAKVALEIFGLLFSVAGLVWFLTLVPIPRWDQPPERIGAISALYCVSAVLVYCVASICARIVIRHGYGPAACSFVSLALFGIPAAILLITQNGIRAWRAASVLINLAIWSGWLGNRLAGQGKPSTQS
jgi:drug/metabolite transporter (DMT)-like permease